MYIDQFLDRHPEIQLPPKILALCREGERRMSLSPDPIHDHHHLGRLFKHLTSFLKRHPQTVDFCVLLPAISWHDIWKGQRQTLNPIKLFYYQVYEGIGSLRIFHQLNKNHLPHTHLSQIGYAIRKHSQFQFLPLKTYEAKILRDIDDLDILSAKRLRPLLKQRHQVGKITKQVGKAFLWWQTRRETLESSQFAWTKKRLAKQIKLVKKLLQWL